MYALPWDHAVTSFAQRDWITMTVLRFPRLVAALVRVAMLSKSEAACCIRAMKDPHMPVGEAVWHYAGGSGAQTDQEAARYVVQDALRKWRTRHRN